jgi:hypothetical protein
MELWYQRGETAIHQQRVCSILIFKWTKKIFSSLDLINLISFQSTTQKRNISWHYQFRKEWKCDWTWERWHVPFPYPSKLSNSANLFWYWNVTHLSIDIFYNPFIDIVWTMLMRKCQNFTIKLVWWKTSRL